MGCVAEIIYGNVYCNGDCDHCIWWDEPQESEVMGNANGNN